VQPGQQVLVNGASGGVGTFAVQIAKSYGAHVTGVCSTRNVQLVRSIGADHVIDYTRENFTDNARRYDVVFDLVGNRSLTECRRALTPTGTLILSGGGVSKGGSLLGPIGLIIRAKLLSRFVRHRLLTLTAMQSKENLATLRELVESGKVTPVIDRTYPLSQAPEAIRYLEVEHARAKVVINV
jgi:NADPH:quinone reductase-like Zn-dependent oxidoreductase